MAEEFWKTSPFGENSIFHPDWDAKQKQVKLQEQQNGEIVGIFIDKGDYREKLFKNNIVYDNLDPSKYRPPVYNPPTVESKTETVIITVSVTIKGNVDSIYISVDQNKQRAVKQLNKYSAVFSLEIPKKEGKKQYEITAQITNFIGNEVFDTKKMKATIDLSGEVLEREEVKCICKRNLTVNEVKNIVKVLRENTYYSAVDPKTKQKANFKLTNLPYYTPEKIFHRNNVSGKFNNEEVTNNSFENFTAQLNNIFDKYEINNCKRIAHFLSQAFIETQYFTQTIESDNSYTSSYDPYRGRGLMHLTHDYNYKKYQEFSEYKVIQNYSLVATNLEISSDSAGWYWKFGSVLGDINKIADTKTVKDVTKAINPALFALTGRENAFNILIGLFDEKDC